MKQKQQKKGGFWPFTSNATTPTPAPVPEKKESSMFDFLKSDTATAEPKVSTANPTMQQQKAEASGNPANNNSLWGGKKQRKSKKQNKSKKQRKSKSRKQ